MDTPAVRYIFCFLLVLLMACQEPSSQSHDKTPIVAVENSAPNLDLTSSKRDSMTHAFPVPEILGRIDEKRHPSFVEIATPYASRSGMYLRSECYEAFRQMADHAKTDGIALVIISAMRNFDRQKMIWEAKWNGSREVDGQKLPSSHPDPLERAKKILEYSSMPGSSRHHWGTDIDINALNNAYFNSGKGLREYLWLQKHAPEYGFCQVYTDKSGGRTGYEEEKWHWSYLPIAQLMTQQAATQMNNGDYNGFLGEEAANEIDVLNNYVLGIDPSCR